MYDLYSLYHIWLLLYLTQWYITSIFYLHLTQNSLIHILVDFRKIVLFFFFYLDTLWKSCETIIIFWCKAGFFLNCDPCNGGKKKKSSFFFFNGNLSRDICVRLYCDCRYHKPGLPVSRLSATTLWQTMFPEYRTAFLTSLFSWHGVFDTSFAKVSQKL